MKGQFNKLTPGEAERLAVLAEECAEIIKAVGKVQRHGYDNTDPRSESGETNRTRLARELGDVRFATAMLVSSGDIDAGTMDETVEARVNERRSNYLHHQDEETFRRMRKDMAGRTGSR